jgi:hypothetical protein
MHNAPECREVRPCLPRREQLGCVYDRKLFSDSRSDELIDADAFRFGDLSDRLLDRARQAQRRRQPLVNVS